MSGVAEDNNETETVAEDTLRTMGRAAISGRARAYCGFALVVLVSVLCCASSVDRWSRTNEPTAAMAELNAGTVSLLFAGNSIAEMKRFDYTQLPQGALDLLEGSGALVTEHQLAISYRVLLHDLTNCICKCDGSGRRCGYCGGSPEIELLNAIKDIMNAAWITENSTKIVIEKIRGVAKTYYYMYCFETIAQILLFVVGIAVRMLGQPLWMCTGGAALLAVTFGVMRRRMEDKFLETFKACVDSCAVAVVTILGRAMADRVSPLFERLKLLLGRTLAPVAFFQIAREDYPNPVV